jgi:hypothetical protein
MLMANEESSELTEPFVGSFYDPSAFVSSQFAAIFILSQFAIFPIRHDQLDAALVRR